MPPHVDPPSNASTPAVSLEVDASGRALRSRAATPGSRTVRPRRRAPSSPECSRRRLAEFRRMMVRQFRTFTLTSLSTRGGGGSGRSLDPRNSASRWRVRARRSSSMDQIHPRDETDLPDPGGPLLGRRGADRTRRSQPTDTRRSPKTTSLGGHCVASNCHRSIPMLRSKDLLDPVRDRSSPTTTTAAHPCAADRLLR